MKKSLIISIMIFFSATVLIHSQEKKRADERRSAAQVVKIDNILNFNHIDISDLSNIEQLQKQVNYNYEHTVKIREHFSIQSEVNYNRQLSRKGDNPDNVDRSKSLYMGAVPDLSINEKLTLRGELSLGIGSSRTKYPGYNSESENFEQLDQNGLLTGINIAAGAYYAPFSDNKLIDAQIGLNIEQNSWEGDLGKDRRTNFYAGLNPAFQFGCEEYLCKEEGSCFKPNAGAYQQGQLYLNSSYVGLNAGRNSQNIDSDRGSKNNFFQGGINAEGGAYIRDNIAGRIRFGFNSFFDRQLSFDNKYNNTNANLGLGVQGHVPTKDVWNNFYAYADADLSYQKDTYTNNVQETATKYSNTQFKLGLGYDWQLTKGYFISLEAGYLRKNTKNKTSDTTTSRSGINIGVTSKLNL